MLRREISPPTEADWCSCCTEGSWAEESSKWNWQLSMIIISKMSQSQLPSWVWKENTVWSCLDQISWLFCTETRVGVEILENWSLMYFPDSVFLFSRVLQCNFPPSSQLSSELGIHILNQPSMELFPVQYQIWYLVFAAGQYGMRLKRWVKNKMPFHRSRKPSLLLAFSSNKSSLF